MHVLGAAQHMFDSASSFNGPLEAWDVGQVIRMRVRRHPSSGLGAHAHTQLAQGSSHKPCACAGVVQLMFVSASAFNQPLAAWDVGQVTEMNVRRRRPASGVQGSHANTAAQGSRHKPCACAGAAQDMFNRATSFNQPLAAWDVSQVTSMWVRRCPASGSGLSRTLSSVEIHLQVVCVCAEDVLRYERYERLQPAAHPYEL